MSDSDEQQKPEVTASVVGSGQWLRLLPIGVFLALCLLFYLALDNDPQKLPSALVGRALPEFTLSSLEDPAKTWQVSDFKGQPFLINVWATWCPSCRVEHGTLLRLSEAGVPILGMNYKDDRADALAYLQRYRNPFTWSIFDGEGSWGFELGVYGAPETFFVDADGVIVHRHVGVITEQNWASDLSLRYQAMGGKAVDLTFSKRPSQEASTQGGES